MVGGEYVYGRGGQRSEVLFYVALFTYKYVCTRVPGSVCDGIWYEVSKKTILVIM